MTFFDKKEEVMKIELTPYGRYLLSIGKLKPHSYRFFDENIIYDSNCGGVVEAQNDAHVRITNDTPILKGNPNITGVETNIKKFDSDDVYIQNVRQPTSDDVISSNNESIGTNDYNSNNSAYYKVDLFSGEFLKDKISNTYDTGSVVGSPIPQIPLNYHLSSSYETNTLLTTNPNVITYDSVDFDDGKKIRITYKTPIIRINQINAFDEMDNLTMTAYKVSSGSNGITYKRLKFPKKAKKIVDNILLDDPPDSVSSLFDGFSYEDISGTDEYIGGEFEDTSRIDYYLEFFTDREISDAEICSAIGDLKVQNIFLDEEVECPDVTPGGSNLNIYATRVSPEDLEDCD